MSRIGPLFYGVICYAVFFSTFLYAVGFVGNLWVPKGIDGGAPGPSGRALLVDVLLLGVFAVQHSVMARPGFKRWWTRLVPASVERSTYVLLSSLALILLFWQWRPMPEPVWTVGGAARTALLALFGLGWLTVLASTFMIDHFDLFGLSQVWRHYRRRPYGNEKFRIVWLYGFVRHPIMLGFVIAFWATPQMTQGHLLFALATTGYILIALQFEERDLATFHGDAYREYQKRVPMLLPWPRSRKG